MEKKKNSSNFLVQGSILAIASIISRIIGLIYRIPMTNIIGDVGNNYYGCAFDIYNVMLIISSYSLPIAVSKLVSAQLAKGKRKMAFQFLKCALVFAVVVGTAASLIVFFGAEFFSAELLKTPYSVYALRILAPALIVVAVLGVLRGFFQGVGTMMPSAISQVVEQIVNAIVSVWAAYVLFSYGKRVGAVLGDVENCSAAYGAAGGTLGTNLGSVAALLFVLIVFLMYIRVFQRQMMKDRHKRIKPFGYVMGVLVVTIIPVLLSTTIYNISGIVDQGIFKNIALLQGYSEHQVDVWWGVFSGKYKLLINVPISIASALAASSVPALTASFADGDMDAVRNKINSAMRFIMIIAVPCAVGLAVLATPIFTLLFPSTVETVDLATTMMLVGAVAVIFYAVSTLSNGLLQGINRLQIPVINAIIALILHVILLIVLMLWFHLHIFAVVIANTVFALIVCILNAWALARHSGHHQEVIRTFIIPVGCSLIMGVVTFLVYRGLYYLTKILSLSLIISIIIAVTVYMLTLLLFKGVREEELCGFPRVVALLKKLHLI